jgi:DNA-3-methyladenine glycosylase II
MSNEDVIAALTAITGIGVWSANVFLIFTLGRMDVVPIGELGMRQAARLVYGTRIRVE